MINRGIRENVREDREDDFKEIPREVFDKAFAKITKGNTSEVDETPIKIIAVLGRCYKREFGSFSTVCKVLEKFQMREKNHHSKKVLKYIKAFMSHQNIDIVRDMVQHENGSKLINVLSPLLIISHLIPVIAELTKESYQNRIMAYTVKIAKLKRKMMKPMSN